MTASRAGTPPGKIAWRRASRLSCAADARAGERLERRPLAAELVADARATFLLDVTAPERVLLVPRALEVAPSTPWARRRWAPSAAARVNVRPHSGHLNVSDSP